MNSNGPHPRRAAGPGAANLSALAYLTGRSAIGTANLSVLTERLRPDGVRHKTHYRRTRRRPSWTFPRRATRRLPRAGNAD
jgi:hypothetical protein